MRAEHRRGRGRGLVNEKFTDDLERELAGQAYRKRY
jgi:hypothetical protein